MQSIQSIWQTFDLQLKLTTNRKGDFPRKKTLSGEKNRCLSVDVQFVVSFTTETPVGGLHHLLSYINYFICTTMPQQWMNEIDWKRNSFILDSNVDHHHGRVTENYYSVWNEYEYIRIDHFQIHYYIQLCNLLSLTTLLHSITTDAHLSRLSFDDDSQRLADDDPTRSRFQPKGSPVKSRITVSRKQSCTWTSFWLVGVSDTSFISKCLDFAKIFVDQGNYQ